MQLICSNPAVSTEPEDLRGCSQMQVYTVYKGKPHELITPERTILCAHQKRRKSYPFFTGAPWEFKHVPACTVLYVLLCAHMVAAGLPLSLQH